MTPETSPATTMSATASSEAARSKVVQNSAATAMSAAASSAAARSRSRWWAALISAAASSEAARSSVVQKVAAGTLPQGVTTSFQGSAQAFQSSMKGLWVLLVMAVLVIYIVLGILYESYIHPLTILSGLPAAGFGAARITRFAPPLRCRR